MLRFCTLIIGLIFPTIAHAFSLSQAFDCSGFLYCGSPNIVNILSSRATFVIAEVAFGVCVVVFLYGGIRMMMSRGEEGKEEGKKALIYGALGFILASLTLAAVASIISMIGQIS